MASNDKTFSFQSDRAITDLEADRLDRGNFVVSLSKVLVKPDGISATGISIGLVGQWGEGKSSILQLLRRDLSARYQDIIIVEFSPWLVSQRHDLLRAFFEELSRTVGTRFSTSIHGSRRSQVTEEVIGALADYGERLAPAFELIHPGGGTAAKIATFGIKKLTEYYRDRRAKDKNLNAIKGRVETLLTELAVPIVILVDEVDRIDDYEIRELMHLVKAVADFPTISYILAYDETRVAEALGFEAPFPRDRVIRGRKYLEKIVQIPIQLPIIFDDELGQLLDDGLREALASEYPGFPGYSSKRYVELRKLLIPKLLITTRDIRRLISSFAHRISLLSGEVDWVDVLGFVALSISAPELALKIRMSPDTFVFDGGTFINPREQAFEEFFKDLTSISERQTPIKNLFGFLFPALSHHRKMADCLLDEVAFRRPLLTLLRMKALSTAIGRADVLLAAQMQEKELMSNLDTVALENKSVAFSQRLADLVRMGAVHDSAKLWIALLITVDRLEIRDWTKLLARRDALREITDDLLSLILKDIGFETQLRTVIEALCQTDAIEAASMLIRRLRYNFLRGNLAVKEAVDKVGISLNWLESEGEQLVRRAKGLAASKSLLPPVVVVYLAQEIGNWNSYDRGHYANVLESEDDAFDRFVVESFGGNYLTDPKTIEDLFMPLEGFRVRVLKRRSEITDAESVELRHAYERVSERLSTPNI